MGRIWTWLARHPLIAHLGVTATMVGLVFGLAFTRDQVHEADQARHDQCVQRWADQTAERSLAVAKARRDVDVADAELWRTVSLVLANPSADGQVQLQTKVNARVLVTDRYEESLMQNPVPPPPKLVCEG